MTYVDRNSLFLVYQIFGFSSRAIQLVAGEVLCTIGLVGMGLAIVDYGGPQICTVSSISPLPYG